MSPCAALVAIDCDDCVHMLLGKGQCDYRSLYFTGSWLRSEKFIGKEYRAAQEKYGVYKTDHIYQRLLSGYTHLRMIDTGAYDLSRYQKDAIDTAKCLNLQFAVQQGELSLLREFLTFRWNRHVFVSKPDFPLS